MEQQQNKSNEETPAFGIAMIIGAVLFIILLNHLPFPIDYGFWPLAGIFVASCAVGGLILAVATSIMSAVFKAIVEIAVVILLLFNVSYVAVCWASFDLILMELNIDPENTFVGILILALILLIINLFNIFFLLPLSKIAGSKVLEDIWS